MASIEEKVEGVYKAELDRLGVDRWSKNEAPNPEIRQALDDYESKSGGSGRNYPDIQSLLDSSTRHILKNNTLIASIHMPDKLFSGKASVQTAVYVFQINRPHEEDDIVKFINFTDDGYNRQNRKKSSQEVNLRDTGDAAGRYAEMEALVLGKKPKTSYYTKENGLYIEDTMSLNRNDWTFAQHKVIDTTPTEEDFKKTVANYLTWKVGTLLRREANLCL